MKSNTLIYPLLIALTTVSLATTGCKHKPMRVTNLPGQTGNGGNFGGGGDTGPAPLPPTPPVNPPENPVTPGNIPFDKQFDPANYTADPLALAANTVHFPFDSSAIKPGEEANITAVANALTSVATDCLMISGNCDERGTEEYNRALGERRADALREALVKLGVSANRINTISYGKDKPADPGHNEAAWSKNRRGEFILMHPKAGAGAPGV